MFLLFLATLFIPLAVHIWGTRVKRKIFFSGIEYLYNSKIEGGSTNKIRKFLLLFIRTAFLAGIVFAFYSNNNSLVPLVNTNLYLADNSASNCSVLNSQVNEKLNHYLASDNKPSDCSKKQRGMNYYLKSDNQLKYLFSDFQQSFIDNRLKQYAGNVNLVVLKNELGYRNISVDSVWVSENFIKYNSSTLLNVLIRNNGTELNENVLVEFKVGGKSVASKLVKIESLAVKKLQFPVTIKDSNDRNCELSIDDASWTFDNSFYFTLNPVENFNIVLLGENSETNNAIKTAFDQESIFKIKQISSFGQSLDVLSKADLMIVSQESGLNENEKKIIYNYAISGGTVLILPSEIWNAKDVSVLNKMFNKDILILKSKEQIQLKIPDIENPFFSNVFEKKSITTTMPVVSSTLILKNADEVIFNLGNEDIGFGNWNLGKGKVYIFSFDMNQSQSFINNALFLPTFYRVAERAIKNKLKPYFRNDNNIVEFLPKSEFMNINELFSIENGTFKIVPEQRIVNEKVKLFLPTYDMPFGIWHIKNKKGEEIAQFGWNMEKSESVAKFYSVSALKEKFKDDSKIKVMSFDDFKHDLDQNKTIDSQWPFWRFAIVISFLFLLAEILVARYFKSRPLSV